MGKQVAFQSISGDLAKSPRSSSILFTKSKSVPARDRYPRSAGWAQGNLQWLLLTPPPPGSRPCSRSPCGHVIPGTGDFRVPTRPRTWKHPEGRACGVGVACGKAPGSAPYEQT